MDQDDLPTRAPARPGPYIAVLVILAVGITLPLIVPIYARSTPALFGLPFFYWYQMLWVVIEAVLLLVCYRILRAEDRRRRAALTQAGRMDREGDR
ncbi:MAG: DUF3311 domain-containing protein [Acidobacteria bacterium]|nr:DUF3311 domain-containing protein [Acidobacteriota bacterium]